MGEKIWCNGTYWSVTEYNKRLSQENKLDAAYDKTIEKLEKERDSKIKTIWESK